MRNKLLSGTACAALCLVSFSGAARSATLDDVMARLDKIEKENAELRAESPEPVRGKAGSCSCRPRAGRYRSKQIQGQSGSARSRRDLAGTAARPDDWRHSGQSGSVWHR